MNITLSSAFRPALFALGCAFALIVAPAVRAELTAQPMADKAKALPLTTAFEKGTPGENGGPHVLVLTNTGDKALKVSGTIIWSVASHNRANTIKLPAHVIEPGANWKISDLAAHDRVVLEAEGYEKLEVTTPAAK